MEQDKKAEVISLFQEMGRTRRANEPRPDHHVKVGDTTIIGSTIVVCDPGKIAEVLSALGKQ